MSIEASIAHAIRNDLDIIHVLPEIQELPMEQLQPYIEGYILQIQDSLYRVITKKGEVYLRSHDAAGLCATCLQDGVSLPPEILLKMCQTIIQLNTLDAQFILDTPEGASLYYVKMALA
jgi:hypothetical protein